MPTPWTTTRFLQRRCRETRRRIRSTSTETMETPTSTFATSSLAPPYGNPKLSQRVDSKAARYILSGWTLSPVVVLSSGLPFSPSVSGNLPSSSGTFTGVIGAGGSTRVPFFARNSFRQPHFFNTDIRIAKDFHIYERATLQVSVDIFNLFNNVNITSIGTQLFSSISGTSTAPVLNYANPATSTFSLDQNGNNGTFTPTPRLIQLGGRISF